METPCQTWRMDLQMLGTLLMELTTDGSTSCWATWNTCCAARQAKEELTVDRGRELYAMWLEDLTHAHPVIQAFLRVVQEDVSWTQPEPPSALLYATLRAILTGSTPTPCPSPEASLEGKVLPFPTQS